MFEDVFHSLARPEHGINSEFAHFVNEHHKIMAETFAERFVDHRNISLAAKAIPEFAFHHGRLAHLCLFCKGGVRCSW